MLIIECSQAKVLFVSDTVSEVLNEEPEDWIGSCLYDILHPKVKVCIVYLFQYAYNHFSMRDTTLSDITSKWKTTNDHNREWFYSTTLWWLALCWVSISWTMTFCEIRPFINTLMVFPIVALSLVIILWHVQQGNVLVFMIAEDFFHRCHMQLWWLSKIM